MDNCRASARSEISEWAWLATESGWQATKELPKKKKGSITWTNDTNNNDEHQIRKKGFQWESADKHLKNDFYKQS